MCDYQYVFACGGKVGSYVLSAGLCEAKTKHNTYRPATGPEGAEACPSGKAKAATVSIVQIRSKRERLIIL